MPWYRIHGLMVHMRGTKLPAPCRCRLATSNPIVPPRLCFAPSAFLCDFELPQGGTCDAPMCEEHAHQVAKDRHLCPEHLARLRAVQPELC